MSRSKYKQISDKITRLKNGEINDNKGKTINDNKNANGTKCLIPMDPGHNRIVITFHNPFFTAISTKALILSLQ